MTTSVPFVLRVSVAIPTGSSPNDCAVFDPTDQIWRTANTWEPVVLAGLESRRGARASNPLHSQFGETSITETGEGTDQSEGTRPGSLLMSTVGETVLTKTHEGHDQVEGVSHAPLCSHFGETVTTRTREGADQSERSA